MCAEQVRKTKVCVRRKHSLSCEITLRLMNGDGCRSFLLTKTSMNASLFEPLTPVVRSSHSPETAHFLLSGAGLWAETLAAVSPHVGLTTSQRVWSTVSSLGTQWSHPRSSYFPLMEVPSVVTQTYKDRGSQARCWRLDSSKRERALPLVLPGTGSVQNFFEVSHW